MSNGDSRKTACPRGANESDDAAEVALITGRRGKQKGWPRRCEKTTGTRGRGGVGA